MEVSVLNRNDLLRLDDDVLLGHCHLGTYRSSGPGGQHRNKTDSAVRITTLDGAVVASSAEHRSQHRNRSEALRRLRIALAIELRMPVPPGSDTELWQGSWKLGRKDRRYASFLAHILDVLSHNDWAVGEAARGLGISTGKLVRNLSHDPQAWNAVNKARGELGLVNLRKP